MNSGDVDRLDCLDQSLKTISASEPWFCPEECHGAYAVATVQPNEAISELVEKRSLAIVEPLDEARLATLAGIRAERPSDLRTSRRRLDQLYASGEGKGGVRR